MPEEPEKRKAYPSDLTDAQWAIVEPLIPAPRSHGGDRPLELDLRREVLTTLLYLNRSGCQWEMLPHDLLPKSSGYDYFAQWRDDGTWTKILTVHQLCREGQAAQERAEAAIALSSEQGFLVWSAQGTILQGWALAEQGQKKEGIMQMCQGLASWRPTGAEIARPFYLALLAEAYGKVGQTEEGLILLAEALAAVHKTGERYYEVELYRLKGTLTLQQENQKAKIKRQKAKIEADPRPLIPKPKPKRVFTKPSRSPGSSRRSRGSCGRR